jgi:hypothetical protein
VLGRTLSVAKRAGEMLRYDDLTAPAAGTRKQG